MIAINALWEVFEVFGGHMDDSEIDCSKINIISLVNIESKSNTCFPSLKILFFDLST